MRFLEFLYLNRLRVGGWFKVLEPPPYFDDEARVTPHSLLEPSTLYLSSQSARYEPEFYYLPQSPQPHFLNLLDTVTKSRATSLAVFQLSMFEFSK
jgi:hypothetical protein